MEINQKNDLEELGKKKKSKKKWIIIAVIVFVLVILLISILGSKGIEPEYKDGEPVYVNENDIDLVYSDADSYVGKFIELNGIVFSEPEYDEKGTYFQIWADAKNNEKNTIIAYEGKFDVDSNEYVKIVGYVAGMEEYENTYGAKMQAPVIIATEIEKSNYKDVVVPTLAEKTYTDKIINQYGHEIRVDKVEFADTETRVYITVTNNSDDTFSVFEYSAMIIQNGKQYELDNDYMNDYEELQNDLQSGVSSSGVLVFPKIEQSDFELMLEGMSGNWEIGLTTYKFAL